MFIDPDKFLLNLAAASTIACITFAAGPAHSQDARMLLDCTYDGQSMTISVEAVTKGGGPPEPIPSATTAMIAVDQKIDGQFVRISAANAALTYTALPVSAQFPLCGSSGPLTSDLATQIRGRATLSLPNIGFVSATCSPKQTPTC